MKSHRALAFAVLLGGCSHGFPTGWVFYPTDSVELQLIDATGNDAAMRYGLASKGSSAVGNDIMTMGILAHSAGYFLLLENNTQYSMIVDWSRCGLVDGEGWSYSIAHPDSWPFESQKHAPEVVVAGKSKRILPLIPSTFYSKRFFNNRPKRSFHPPLRDVAEGGLSERIILCIRWKDQELFFEMAFKLCRMVAAS